MRKYDDETAIEFMRRVVEWLSCESESLLSDLSTVEAVLEYADLWSVYKTDFMSGILECIAEGDDPKPLQRFIKKHKLNAWAIPQHILDAHNESLVKT